MFRITSARLVASVRTVLPAPWNEPYSETITKTTRIPNRVEARVPKALTYVSAPVLGERKSVVRASQKPPAETAMAQPMNSSASPQTGTSETGTSETSVLTAARL